MNTNAYVVVTTSDIHGVSAEMHFLSTFRTNKLSPVKEHAINVVITGILESKNF